MDQLSGDWEVACLRLEDYLRAHGVQPRERLLVLTLEIIREARELHLNNPGKSPMQTTMELAIGRTDEWFAMLAGSAENAVRARVAFFSPAIHRKWAFAFLVPSPPVGMLAEVRTAGTEAGPELDFQSLIRREMDYGAMEDIARETWEQFSWSHVLRAFVLWLVIFLAAYGLYLTYFQ